jgi:hypothetical protein
LADRRLHEVEEPLQVVCDRFTSQNHAVGKVGMSLHHRYRIVGAAGASRRGRTEFDARSSPPDGSRRQDPQSSSAHRRRIGTCPHRHRYRWISDQFEQRFEVAGERRPRIELKHHDLRR